MLPTNLSGMRKQNANYHRVSILVLMDVAHKPPPDSCMDSFHLCGVSILVLMDVAHKQWTGLTGKWRSKVSILVLMDVAHKPKLERIKMLQPRLFQSLF